jgi:hypothetical protein
MNGRRDGCKYARQCVVLYHWRRTNPTVAIVETKATKTRALLFIGSTNVRQALLHEEILVACGERTVLI